ITWRVAAFSTTNRDDILFVTDDPSGFGYFRNFGRTRRQGFEADVRAHAGTLSFSGYSTYLDSTYRSAETVGGASNSNNDGPARGSEGDIDTAPGDKIPLIPRHTLKLGAEWEVAPGFKLSAEGTASSGVYARGNENNQHQADGLYYLGPGKTKA